MTYTINRTRPNLDELPVILPDGTVMDEAESARMADEAEAWWAAWNARQVNSALAPAAEEPTDDDVTEFGE